MRKIINSLVYFFDCIIPKNDKQFAFSSFPAISDNSYAMFKYLYLSSKNLKMIWLLSDTKKIDMYKKILTCDLDLSESDFMNITFVQKNSMLGLFYYARSKYVFFTHGLYPRVKFPKNHILVNLWHGMPLKTIGLLDDPNNKDIPGSTYTIATSVFFQNYMSKAFGLKEYDVLVSGQPRNDILFEKNNCLRKFNIDINQYKKIFLWTPTYRQATIGYTNIDGEIFNGLPVIAEEYEVLNQNLKTLDSFMIIKLHPMDILNRNKFKKYTNLLFLTSDDLTRYCCQLNQILGSVDVLMTDFSSIYIDFLLLNRPIGFVMDDFEKFSNSRGFVMENTKDYMPGEFISSKNNFFDFLNKCIEGLDDFKDKRREANDIFNEIKTGFSKQLWFEILEREK